MNGMFGTDVESVQGQWVTPLQGYYGTCTCPRAVPWAIESGPFGAKQRDTP